MIAKYLESTTKRIIMNFEMDMEVRRTKDGKLIGFEVVPQPHMESEMFCTSFPKALLNREQSGADITIRDGRLHLIHPTCRFKGECIFEVSHEDARELNDLLELQGAFAGKELVISDAPLSLTGGFQIHVKQNCI